MPRRRGLTDQQVATLPRRAKRYNYADPEMRGHYLRVSPDRATPISYAAVARDPGGKQIWATLGTTEALGIEQARELARVAIRRIKAGEPTVEPAKRTLGAVTLPTCAGGTLQRCLIAWKTTAARPRQTWFSKPFAALRDGTRSGT